MQIVKIMGGLGNQMFAYAFALALKNLGREVALDPSWHEKHRAHNGWELSRVFNLEIPLCSPEDRGRLGDLSPRFASRLRRKILGPRSGHFIERGSGYDPQYLRIKGDAYFEGYWQSFKYHSAFDFEMEAVFRFPPEIETESLRLLEDARGRTTIGIHVRRGDYLESQALGGVCDETYYHRAIDFLSEGVVDPILLFFSDDLDWCKDRLGKQNQSSYVDWNRGPKSWRDMRLMTLCDRLVISNSSFGWWGARLGVKADRPIAAPSRWYGAKHSDNVEIVPPGWTRIAARSSA